MLYREAFFRMTVQRKDKVSLLVLAGIVWGLEEKEGKGISERGNVMSQDLEMEKPRAYRGTIGGPAGERVEVVEVRAKEFGKLMQGLKRRVM